MQFTIFQESRKGSRSTNQDRIAYTYSREALLLVVADGMGGHAGGEIAAQIAVRMFVERFHREATPALRSPLAFLHDTMVNAHTALGSYSTQYSMLETPRTTCVACIVQGGHAYWAHVGDSRLCHFRQGALLSQTRDHSKVQYLVDQGLLSSAEVGEHPDRNKVYSCLGGMVEPVIDLSTRTLLRDGDILAAVHGRVVGSAPQRRDRDLARVEAHPEGDARNDAGSRAPRRHRRRQPLRDRRALGSGDAGRRAGADHHRNARSRRVRHPARPDAFAGRPQGRGAAPSPTTRSSARSTTSRRRSAGTGADFGVSFRPDPAGLHWAWRARVRIPHGDRPLPECVKSSSTPRPRASIRSRATGSSSSRRWRSSTAE